MILGPTFWSWSSRYKEVYCCIANMLTPIGGKLVYDFWLLIFAVLTCVNSPFNSSESCYFDQFCNECHFMICNIFCHFLVILSNSPFFITCHYSHLPKQLVSTVPPISPIPALPSILSLPSIPPMFYLFGIHPSLTFLPFHSFVLFCCFFFPIYSLLDTRVVLRMVFTLCPTSPSPRLDW